MQFAADRVTAGEPADIDKLNAAGIPRRLMESLGLVSKLANARKRSWADHVDDYVRELESAGRNAAYVAKMKRTLTNVGTVCGWSTIADADRDELADYLRTKATTAGTRTVKNARDTVRSFLRWAVRVKRIDRSALDVFTVDVGDPSTDRRLIRRALTDDEIGKLFKHVAGTDRELVYRFALATGLRWRECRELQWRDVHADTPCPCLRLRPESTKSKRADEVPLSADIAARLIDYKSRKPFSAPTDRVFTYIPAWKRWKADVVAAGITYKDTEGRICGFHSVRVTLGTRLDRMGLSVKDRMRIMRHTDPTVSYDVYSDVRLSDLQGSVNRLPTFDATATESAQATGTNGTSMESEGNQRTQNRTQKRTQTGDGSRLPGTEADVSECDESPIESGEMSDSDGESSFPPYCGQEESNLHDLAITRT